MNNKKARLIEGDVSKTLVGLAAPMMFGLLGIFAFNLVDAFFIGKLGTNELAGLSFTFPVVMIIFSLILGIGIGSSAVISRAIGEGNHHKVERINTDSMLLSLLIVIVFSAIGIMTIDPVFRMLGATPEILPLIRQYMIVWYGGVALIVIPVVGNNTIRALGDTKTASAIMLIAVLFNCILDPLFIFGIGPFPRLGLPGAAVATVLSRAITFIVTMYILYVREKMITFEIPKLSEVLESWKKILYLGLPTAGTRIMIPISIGIVTRIVSSYGTEAVAAFGVATRIEAFAMTAIFALAMVIGPFVGQNWGAGKNCRALTGIKYSKKFSMLWGFVMFIVFLIASKPIAAIFNNEPGVVSMVSFYLKVVSAGYGMQGLLIISSAALVVLHRPLQSAALVVMEMFFLYIPFCLLGSFFYGILGVFCGIALSYILSGVLANIVFRRALLTIKDISAEDLLCQ